MTTRVLVTGGSGFIGTTLVHELIDAGHAVLSIDLDAPTLAQHQAFWMQGDVLDAKTMRQALDEFRPTHLVHLAAETEMGTGASALADEYPVNCRSATVLGEVLRDYPVNKAVIVSTQFVCGPSGRLPVDAEDTFPHTRYGESKVVLERDARRCIGSPWVILRPTYVWGPHNRKNFLELLRAVAGGRYLHPGPPAVLRSYAYVRTVSWTIRQALTAEVPAGSTLYATDAPEDSAEFIARLCAALPDRRLRRVPRGVLRGLACVGDAVKAFPMNSFRYFNMTTPYPVPYDWGHRLLGDSPVDLAEAAAETAAWFQARQP